MSFNEIVFMLFLTYKFIKCIKVASSLDFINDWKNGDENRYLSLNCSSFYGKNLQKSSKLKFCSLSELEDVTICGRFNTHKFCNSEQHILHLNGKVLSHINWFFKMRN